MKKYIVVISTDLSRFIDECNEMMELGYIPTGGITINDEHGILVFHQAFYRKEIK